jgi:hypothetical protein
MWILLFAVVLLCACDGGCSPQEADVTRANAPTDNAQGASTTGEIPATNEAETSRAKDYGPFDSRVKRCPDVVPARLRAFDLPVQPADYRSRAGRWSIHVEPESRDGVGPSTMTLSRAGRTRWTKQFPFTLYHVAVAPTGSVAGAAYVMEKGYCQMEVVVLDLDGRQVVQKRHTLRRSRYIHGADHPKPLGAFVAGDTERFVFRILTEPNRKRGGMPHVEEWWHFDFDGPDREGTVKLADALWHVGQMLPVKGTPLLLVSGVDRDAKRACQTFEARDQDGELVRSFSLKRACRDNESYRNTLEDAAQQSETLAPGPRPGTVSLRVINDNRWYTFAFSKEKDGWKTKKIASKRHRAKPSSETRSIRKRKLRLIASTPLQVNQREVTGPVRDIRAYGFTPRGIEFVRGEPGNRFSLVEVDTEGNVFAERALGRVPEARSDRHLTWTRLSTGTWLVIVGHGNDRDPPRPRAYLVHLGDNALTPFSGFAPPRLDYRPVVAATHDGGFVALADSMNCNDKVCWGNNEQLIAYDRDGKPRWEVGHDPDENGEGLFSPSAVAVTTRKEIVVVSAVREDLKYYDHDGKFLRRVEFKRAIGDKRRYPSSVFALGDDACIVESADLTTDDQGVTPSTIWCVSPEGAAKPIATMRTRDFRASRTQQDSTGQWWTYVDDAFYRVIEDRLAHAFGPIPSDTMLNNVGQIVVDQHERVLLHDAKTNDIYVFDKTGRQVKVARANDADRESQLDDAPLLVSDDRTIYHGPRAFDANGERRGANLKFSERYFIAASFARGSNDLWVFDGPVLKRRTLEGEVLQTIERQPDNRWWTNGIHGVAVTPSGILVVFDAERQRPGVLSLFSAAGEPLAAYPIPELRGHWGEVLATDDWAALQLPVGVVLVRLRDGAMFKLKGVSARGFSANGSELWAVGGRPWTLYRYALP